MSNTNPITEHNPKIPSDVKRTYRWGFRGSRAETQLRLARDHIIVYQREDKLVRHTIHLFVDGEETFEKTIPTFVLIPRKLEHHFQLEEVPCRFVFRIIPLGLWLDVRVFVNDVKVMRV